MRKRSLSLGVAVLVLLAACGGEPDQGSTLSGLYLGGPPPATGGGFDYDLTIVFTNDIHDQIVVGPGKPGGLARHMTLMQALRGQAAERGKGFFAANGGDCFEGSLFYERDGGSALFQVLELLGYDVVQIGNHDHQFGSQRLFDVIQDAFPNLDQGLRFLYGNVNPADMFEAGTTYTGQATFLPSAVQAVVIDAFENAFVDLAGTIDPTLFDPPLANSKLFNQTLFFDVQGIRIGVFGVDTTEALYASYPGQGELLANPNGVAENLIFIDPITSGYASAMIDYLDDPDGNAMTDDGADLILVVTHVGIEVDEMIALNAVGQNGRRIDVIVGGHDHLRLNTAVTIEHASGERTHIVQAGSKGEFLGRLDLSIDPGTNAVELVNAELLEVTADISEDPATAAFVQELLDAPGGVNETYGNPIQSVIATNDWLLPGGIPASSALGNLAADACIAIGNQPPHSLGLDAMVIGNFVFRADICPGDVTIADAHAVLPLHVPDLTGLSSDSIDYIDLPGGIREALSLASFPFPAPNLTNITALEYLLEVVYSVDDVVGILSQLFGLDVGSVAEFVEGLQWSGIEFVVDGEGPVLQKIDTASIFVNGVPLVGNEQQSFRVGLNAIIARFAIPFVQFLVQIEDPPGSGVLVPFPNYDPSTNASSLALWEALRSHLEGLQALGAMEARVLGRRVRTVAPDVTYNPVDVVVAPLCPACGSTATAQFPVLNIGETGVTDALVTLEWDPTPGSRTDDPDGFTDAQTGAAFPVLGTAQTGPIPAFVSGMPGQVVVPVSFTVPVGTPPGTYPLFATLSNVISDDPVRPESVIFNNGGRGFPVWVTIP